jgi:hypothetical protein
MGAQLIVRGDLLPVLQQLAATQASGLEPPRAVVWGADLRDATSKRDAQKRLVAHCRDVAAVAAAHPQLAHVFVAYSHGGVVPAGGCLATAARAAARLHAELERARGRYVEVVLLDVTGCEDANTLERRVTQAIATPAGVAGDVALGWTDIVDSSIHAAAARELC